MTDAIKKSIQEHEEKSLYHEKQARLLKSQHYNRNWIEKEILKDLAKKHWVWVEEIMWKSVYSAIMPARRELVKILRDEYNYWFQRIGDIINRHHASVMYLYKTSKWNQKTL